MIVRWYSGRRRRARGRAGDEVRQLIQIHLDALQLAGGARGALRRVFRD